jgi:spore maturation protein CgeB
MLKQNKIVVSGSYGNCLSITDSVVHALRFLGYSVFEHQFFKPLLNIEFPRYHNRKILPQLILNQHKEKIQLNRMIRNVRPEILLLLRGDEVDIDTVLQLRKRIGFRIWLWMFDPLHRTPNLINLLPVCDKIFHYAYNETGDLKFKYPEKEVHFLPGAFDDRFYKIELNSRWKYDLFFCGALDLKTYASRNTLLNEFFLISDSIKPKFKTSICYGRSNRTPVKNYLDKKICKQNYSYLYANLQFKTYCRIQLAKKYAQSLAGLTLQDSSEFGVGLSWRTFELLGSGAVVISDSHPDIERCFSDGSEAILKFEKAQDIVDRLVLLRQNSLEREKIIKIYERICKEHTYTKRMTQMGF